MDNRKTGSKLVLHALLKCRLERGNLLKIASRIWHVRSVIGARSLAVWRAKLRPQIRLTAHLVLQLLASPYRALVLRRVVFIGVTGSCGKTTAKDLLYAVLTTQFPGRKSSGNRNHPSNLATTILRVRPWHKFCVLEIAITTRGGRIPLEVPIGLARPQIGIVTTVGREHLGTIEAVAAEKAKLVAALPPNGTAVLNADDPNCERDGNAACGADHHLRHKPGRHGSSREY